jgi:hypothetical protein
MALFGSLGEVNVGALSATTTDNAVDVFVYDTRKDSDGGQWRKRTQHTSWYNETLNTATRGSRRDFPAVAVIVRETGKLTIYDGDDPDMPMWMVFEANNNTSTSYLLEYYTTGGTSVSALNGVITSGHNSNGATTINFISEKSIRYRLTATSGTYEILASIANRNTFVPITFTQYDNTIGLVNSAVNDVAMTVLPNAPIDSATGLPVPTIAVACGPSNSTGGISVINDNGIVSNVSPGSNVTFYTVRWIDNTRLYAGSIHISGVIGFRHYILNYPSLNVERIEGHSYDDTGLNWSGGLVAGLGGGIFGNEFATIKDGFSIGYDGNGGYTGLNLINYDPNPNSGLFAYIKSNFNTGWMHGDIKGAWLSDTSTASVTGTELITNGTFDSNTTGWTANTSTNTWSSGTMQITRSGGSGQTTYQAFTTVAGQRYVATAQVNSSGSRGDMYAVNGTGWAGTTLGGALGTSGQTRTLTVTFVATSTSTTLGFIIDANGTSIVVDNVSVRLAEADRSVNSNGLQVFGTITKSVVATGANLVGYSGFNAFNNLVQPYNSNLNFGTGDFSVIAWIKKITLSTNHYVFDRGDGSTDNDRFGYIVDNAGTLFFFAANSSGVFTTVQSGGGLFVGSNNWRMIHAVRRSGITYLGLDGVDLFSSVALSGFNITGSGDEKLVVGQYNNTTTFPVDYAMDNISLLRISASAPSPDQIRKIYNDEKALFQPNSQCTLYGSSDNVVAIAYDDTNSTLLVGTSSGRSDFRGLERINNTTTAVTTAISASNGLIAEQ